MEQPVVTHRCWVGSVLAVCTLVAGIAVGCDASRSSAEERETKQERMRHSLAQGIAQRCAPGSTLGPPSQEILCYCTVYDGDQRMYDKHRCDRTLKGPYQDFRRLIFPHGAPPPTQSASGAPTLGDPNNDTEPATQDGE